jgi:glutamyl-tRNA synthetase
MVRTRVAPSPTGYPHIGTIYQALFDFAWARRNNGSFLVRIEDTDRERLVELAEQKIFEALDWFNLTEDESPRKGGKYAPYRQSERLGVYKKYADALIQKGGAYYCFCTKERLEALRGVQQAEKKPVIYDKRCLSLAADEVSENLKTKTYVIRLKVLENTQIKVKDEIRGEITFDSNLIEDAVLIKSDGFPTYHFAVVIDDHLMEITHVVRGEEWLPSLPKHIVLYDYFDWNKPLFYHTPTLRNPDKSKLSKRHGHTQVQWYKDEGFLPEAILNFLALLGWTHPQEKEEFPLEEFIRFFDLKDLRPVAPIFDITKLEWLNGVYIRKMPTGALKSVLAEFYKDDKEFVQVFKSAHIDLLVGLAQTRMKTLKDFKNLAQATSSTRELTLEEKEVARKLSLELSRIEHRDWMEDKILVALRSFRTQENVSMRLIYFLITGRQQGLPLIETMVRIDGREEVLKKLRKISS